MKVETKGHTTIIKDTQGDLASFLGKITNEHPAFAKQNLIVDISAHAGLTVKDLNSFLALSKAHQKGKKSFVLVADADFNSASDKLVVVPTLLEAHDMIEMDEIERDLGF